MNIIFERHEPASDPNLTIEEVSAHASLVDTSFPWQLAEEEELDEGKRRFSMAIIDGFTEKYILAKSESGDELAAISYRIDESSIYAMNLGAIAPNTQIGKTKAMRETFRELCKICVEGGKSLRWESIKSAVEFFKGLGFTEEENKPQHFHPTLEEVEAFASGEVIS